MESNEDEQPSTSILPRPSATATENPFDSSIIQDSCLVRGIFTSVAGAGLGTVFAFVFTPSNTAPEHLEKPFRAQLLQGYRTSARSSIGMAKNFGIFGGAFAVTECTLEGIRAKSDIYNGVMAGCVTGGALAWRGGPTSIAFGCVGVAAFSGAIDYFLGRHGDATTHVEHDSQYELTNHSIHDEE
eukprot:TRINITY_DN10108_c0_g1_i1.p1 TRINITY_DN10108_c0_g1~~TRINITY_DN10108_c0_g1_i1.p1  ORF type:complete len:198 (-),score=43.13 TRINITY_DN10108_c0_g1_i1:26-580(-)